MIKLEQFTDVRYDVEDGVAVITIDRPDRYNALRGRTVDELIYAFRYAWIDESVGAIVLTALEERRSALVEIRKSARRLADTARPKWECSK